MVFGAMAVFAKLLHLQYVDGDKWRNIADSLTRQECVVEAARGNIYSVDGRLLDTSVPEYEIRFDAMSIPAEHSDVFNNTVDSLVAKLSSFLKDKTARQYLVVLK